MKNKRDTFAPRIDKQCSGLYEIFILHISFMGVTVICSSMLLER